ncbi:MAG: DUF1289 domain-containing protein [Ramlibacter sp.]|uniref:DUF1289 domain-containing protein n=1 Tax=Ramlibacter sp. TaxID=1917967 RepID=UPI0026315684|nr:DUF1289 domain-containing protein [Ramlibacter sp.]MDH4377163.1 DUF1289 domain-containing protein [Ramlibacter sp.]
MSKLPSDLQRGALYQTAARQALITQAALVQASGNGAPGVTSAAPSPCVSICQMDGATGWCGGCLRTLDEVAAWSRLSDAQRRDLWQVLSERAQFLTRLAARPLPPAAP